MHTNSEEHAFLNPLQRIRFWYALLLVVASIFVVRLFYLQVIRHDYYQKVALRGQLKQYEIPAKRGIIEAHSGKQIVPIVLNETKFTLFADPKFIKNSDEVADKIQQVIGGNKAEYAERVKTPDTRYVVLAKKLNKEQSDKIAALKLKGIGTREAEYRTYPQSLLAAQVLGFVNDDSIGKYGIEQSLDAQLKGKPGQLKAITDAAGVPLATNKENILIEPQQGDRVVLTLDIGMQQQLEDLLKKGLDDAKSTSGSALIMDPKTGAIKAMANLPTFNPSEYFKVEDGSVFSNAAVSAPLEVGSIMKPLTAAAALDLGVVKRDTSYYDPSFFKIDGATVKNIEEDGGAGTRNIADILQLSLNTGATWLLMQMGGGEINQKARNTWHDYMTNHYRFGMETGIEQGYESGGSIPDPNAGFGLNIQYANTAFGQGMTATPLQMGAALAAVINGGNYYRPRLVDSQVGVNGKEVVKKPEIVRADVVSAEISQTMQDLMEYAFEKNHLVYGMRNLRPGYSIGGKTGTAEIPNPSGGYFDDKFNGTFMGFVGGDEPEYVIVVRVNEPKIGGYAGSRAAAPIFSSLANMLIDNYGVTPKN